MKSIRIDLTGQKFGRLLVVKFFDKKQKTLYWECLCDCGNTHIVNGQYLRCGDTTSCGCLNKERCIENGIKYGLFKNKSNSSLWKGISDISGEFYNRIQKSAKKRNIYFELSIEYLWQLYLHQNKQCALSGVELWFKTKSKIYDGTASLDRIDNSKGYIEGNVQWVHKDINFMKQQFSQPHFIELCMNVVKHSCKIKEVVYVQSKI